MDFKKIFISGLAVVLMAATQLVLAQEPPVVPVDQSLITSSQESSVPKEADMQWAWGEVTGLDNQTQTVTLKYLDYETDQEKELVLAVDEKTTFENIKDFNELKLKDTLSIDYIIGVDNKNIAKNISFEKPDTSSVSAPAVEDSPLVNSAPSIEKSVVEVAGPAIPAEAAAPDLAPVAVQSEMPVDSVRATNDTSSAPPAELAEPAAVAQN
jgi:hypothetical protein